MKNYLGGLLIVLSWASQSLAGERPDPARWQETIQQMVANRPMAKGTDVVCFIGSSSIRMWDLDRWFSNRQVVNRGFGGSHIADATRFLDDLVFPHEPGTLVLYAGDNDIAKGLTPDQVVDDYSRFMAALRATLPEVRVRYIAIKPSIARWDKSDLMRQANQGIAKLVAEDPKAEFVDIWEAMLGPGGRPDPRYFVEDGLHLNETGYALWTRLLAQHL